MLRLGDLIDYPDEPKARIRIIWFSDCGTTAATICVEEAKALPVLVAVEFLRDELESPHARLLLEDPYQPSFVLDEELKERHKRIRDRAWHLIEDLVQRCPDIFVAHRRGKLINAAIRRFNSEVEDEGEGACVTRVTLYGYLRRYWQRGLIPNALLPDYAKCGAPGQTRTPSDKKRGRPREYGDEVGVNITPEIRRIFLVGVDRCYVSKEKEKAKWTPADLYDKVIQDFFCDKRIDPETKCAVHVTSEAWKAAGGVPTLGQFRYWLRRDHDRLELKRKRVGAKRYDKDMRGLVGTSNAQVYGPGDRYQIDATIADVYLKSRIHRSSIIGRPVIYVVIDVFSRMIVGVYVGLEGPSWAGAMMALANTAADKVAFCKELGLDIEPEDWPCHFLPGALLADRGELESAMANTLVNTFNVRLENTAPYRADWKGLVEKRFHLLPAKFRKYLPGYIEPDFRERGGHDYRLDATLDLREFTQIVVLVLLYYNNFHEISGYDPDRDLLADEVPFIPRELWAWGVHHRTGAMRSFPEQLVKFSLMPTDKAVVTTFGIRFRSLLYTCSKAMEERWFDRARQSERWEVTISYDPRDLSRVYLHVTGHTLPFEVCTLTERSRAYCDASLCEVDQQDKLTKHQRANRHETQALAGMDMGAAVEAITQSATAKQGKPSPRSAAAQTRDIRPNRAQEKAMNREAESFQLGESSASAERPGAAILPLNRPRVPASDDYDAPSIEEILGEDNHD